jgi:hypothetical protein
MAAYLHALYDGMNSQDDDVVAESVGYLSFDPPAPPPTDHRLAVSGAYISSSRIGEIRPKQGGGGSDDDDDEDDEYSASSSDNEEDDSDWSDSDGEYHQPQRPAEGIGPVQDSIWNARYAALSHPPHLPNISSLQRQQQQQQGQPVVVMVVAAVGGVKVLGRGEPPRFQQLVRLADTESKYQQLAHLAHDFQHAAEVYGRIIISERFVPEQFKTIKPLDIGAYACVLQVMMMM